MKPDIASRIAGLAIALLGICATSTPAPVFAQASRVCVPRAAELAQQLGQQYGERLTAAGVDAGGGLVQVYSNVESGTWTIAITLANGPTCIVSSGEGWASEQTPDLPKPGVTS